jgi:hypothetical protein
MVCAAREDLFEFLTMGLNLLLVADLAQSQAAMVSESIDALARWSRLVVTTVTNGVPAFDVRDLNSFDVVIIHYSVFVDQLHHLPKSARAALRNSRALKVVWQQDEHRNINGRARAMNEIEAKLVFTCLPLNAAEMLYRPHLNHETKFLNVMTGYVSDRMLSQSSCPYFARPIDIGYRGREYPLWHGRLGAERMRLASETLKWAQGRGLCCDISTRERDRVYGHAWTDFLNRSKATLGTESGSSVFDVDGTLPEKVWSFVLRHPFASERDIAAATYGPLEGLVDYAQISPRLFEAIAARSLLLLSPGHYSGLVIPRRHAIFVQPGGLNADEIAETIRDPRLAACLVDAAQEEILHRPDLHERAFVSMLDDALEESVGRLPGLPKGRRKPAASETLGRASPRKSGTHYFAIRAFMTVVRALIETLPPTARRYFEALCLMALLRFRRWRDGNVSS